MKRALSQLVLSLEWNSPPKTAAQVSMQATVSRRDVAVATGLFQAFINIGSVFGTMWVESNISRTEFTDRRQYRWCYLAKYSS